MDFAQLSNLATDPSIATLGAALVKSSALVLLTGLLVQVWRGSSASLRSWLWSLCLLSLLLIPVATLLPRWQVALLPARETLTSPGPEGEVVLSPVSRPQATVPGVSMEALETSGELPPKALTPEPGALRSWLSGFHLGLWLPRILFWTWLLGGLGCLSAWLASFYWSRRLIRSGTSAPDRLRSALVGIWRQDRAAPTLLLSDGVHSPAVAGLIHPTILLPLQSLQWSPQRLRLVLLHELAHIERRDCWIQLAARLSCAVYWFNPLVWHANAALRRERERACDDAVLTTGVKASSYARSLLEVARLLQARTSPISPARRAFQPTTISMATRRNLEDRLMAILDVTQPRRVLSGRLRLALLFLGLAALGFTGSLDLQLWAQTMESAARESEVQAEEALPPSFEKREVTPSAAGQLETRSRSTSEPHPHSGTQNVTSYSRSSHDGSMEVRWRQGGRRVEVEATGDIELSDDDRMVTRVSPGGYLRIREFLLRGPNRTLDIVSRTASGNDLEFQFSVDGQVRPFEPEGRRWLASSLLEIVRATGLAVSQRTRRMLRQGGPEAVLSEIRQIDSDGVKVLYFQELAARAELNDGQWIDFLQLASQEIGSDGDKARLLIQSLEAVAKHSLQVHQNWFEAVATISSDGDKSRAVIAAFREFSPESSLAPTILRVVGAISSDGDKSRVLLQWMQEYPEIPLGKTFFEIAATISSDGDLSRVLLEGLRSSSLENSSEDVLRLLRAARTIGSDGDLSRVLIATLRLELSPEVLQELLESTRTIGSDGDLSRVLIEALDHDLSVDLLHQILETARSIGSDGDKARVLLTLAHSHEISGPLREAFLDVADTIGSDGDHLRVLRSIR